MKKEFKALVTGAASGIGHATARALCDMGAVVYGVDISPMEEREKFIPLCADITDNQSLAAVARAIADRGDRLDVIICAAGIHAMASLAESDPDLMRRLINVNLVGTMTCCRILHPLLCDGGRVVIVTSEVASYQPMPFNGLYNVSKTALECYAQALRQELNLIGQKVVTVLPGAVETPLSASSVPATERLAAETRLYTRHAQSFAALVEKFKGKPIPPEKMAKTVLRAATAKHPRLSYSKHRNVGLVLLSLLPRRMQCAIIKLILNKNARRAGKKEK